MRKLADYHRYFWLFILILNILFCFAMVVSTLHSWWRGMFNSKPMPTRRGNFKNSWSGQCEFYYRRWWRRSFLATKLDGNCVRFFMLLLVVWLASLCIVRVAYKPEIEVALKWLEEAKCKRLACELDNKVCRNWKCEVYNRVYNKSVGTYL